MGLGRGDLSASRMLPNCAAAAPVTPLSLLMNMPPSRCNDRQRDPETHDRQGDLKPYKSAELSEGDLDTVAPGIGNSIGGSLYNVSDVSQRPFYPFRVIIERGDDQEPGCSGCRDAEGMNFCVMLEAGIVPRLINRRRADHEPGGEGTHANANNECEPIIVRMPVHCAPNRWP